MAEKPSFEEIIKSTDIPYLNKARLEYEEDESYELCARLRDRIKEIRDAHINNNIVTAT